jgi:hypothetical protein
MSPMQMEAKKKVLGRALTAQGIQYVPCGIYPFITHTVCLSLCGFLGWLFDAFLRLNLPLCVPLSCWTSQSFFLSFSFLNNSRKGVVDLMGFRVAAESIAPIEPKKTLRYGCRVRLGRRWWRRRRRREGEGESLKRVRDGGGCVERFFQDAVSPDRKIHFDPQIDELMRVLATHMNLKKHILLCRSTGNDVSLWTPIDMEVHQGLDGRYYLLDVSRVFPPTLPLNPSNCNLIPQLDGRIHFQVRSTLFSCLCLNFL